MPRLPDVDSLGGLPAVSPARRFARVDTSAVGEAVARFGRSIAQAGATIADGAGNGSRAGSLEAFNTDKAVLDFRYDETKRRDEFFRDLDPSNITGAAERYAADYKSRADTFAKKHLVGLKDADRARYDQRLYLTEIESYEAAKEFEDDQVYNFAVVGAQELVDETLMPQYIAWAQSENRDPNDVMPLDAQLAEALANLPVSEIERQNIYNKAIESLHSGAAAKLPLREQAQLDQVEGQGVVTLPSFFDTESREQVQGVAPNLLSVASRAQQYLPEGYSFQVGDRVHGHGGIGGKRTREQQAEIVKRGASRTMESKHIEGLAVDFTPYKEGRPDESDEAFAVVNQAMKKAAADLGYDVEWGGDWKGFVDKYHYQLDPKQAGFHGIESNKWQVGAATLLRQFEGFRREPYYDVNALRAGYGSDTVTLSNGRVMRVSQETRVTKEDAERDLERRIADEFGPIAQKAAGANWNRLPNRVKAALTSVAYNYGDMPNGVTQAIQTGNIETIARSVEALKSHNNGVNASRRQVEADVIRGDISRVTGQPATYGPTRQALWGLSTTDTFDLASKARGQIEADNEQAAADFRENIVKDLQVLLDEDRLTVDDVNQWRDVLSASDFAKYHRGATDAGENPELPREVYTELLNQAIENPGETLDTLDDLWIGEAIGKGDYNRIRQLAIGELQSPRRSDFIQSQVAEVSRPKRSIVGLPPTPRQQQAHNDSIWYFKRWVDDNQDASQAEIRREALAVIADRDKYAAMEASTYLPLPQYGHVSSSDELNYETLASARQRTASALLNGEIDEAMAAREADLIDRWGEIVKLLRPEQAAPKPLPPPKVRLPGPPAPTEAPTQDSRPTQQQGRQQDKPSPRRATPSANGQERFNQFMADLLEELESQGAFEPAASAPPPVSEGQQRFNSIVNELWEELQRRLQ